MKIDHITYEPFEERLNVSLPTGVSYSSHIKTGDDLEAVINELRELADNLEDDVQEYPTLNLG